MDRKKVQSGKQEVGDSGAASEAVLAQQRLPRTSWTHPNEALDGGPYALEEPLSEKKGQAK